MRCEDSRQDVQGKKKNIIAALHEFYWLVSDVKFSLAPEGLNPQWVWQFLNFKGISLVNIFCSVRKEETKQPEAQRKKVRVLQLFSTTFFFLQREWVFFECDPTALRSAPRHWMLHIVSFEFFKLADWWKIKWELFTAAIGPSLTDLSTLWWVLGRLWRKPTSVASFFWTRHSKKRH